MRAVAVLLCLLLFAPVVGANYETGNESWREVEVDVSQWDDGPELEDLRWITHAPAMLF